MALCPLAPRRDCRGRVATVSARFLARRFRHALVVLIGVSLIAFALIHSVPGDPVRIALGPHASQAAVNAGRHQAGLDRPLYQQYADFISGAVQGNFGYSIQQRASVSSLVVPRIGPSILLLIYAALLSVVIALPLGVISGLRRNRPADHTIRATTMITFAMPPFWLALILVEIFSLRLHLFPVAGYGGSLGERLRDLTLPAVTVSFFVAPMLVRTLRGSMIDALSSDYVEAARARGLSEGRVVLIHSLRNASVSTLNVLAVTLAFLIGGTVVVEVAFAIPGLGSLIVSSIQARDFPLIQALTLLFGGLVVIVTLLADIFQGVIDPRART